jgi:hypothetical protein
MASPRDVTALLGDWTRGNRTALNRLLPLVYAEFRCVAARQLRNERADHALATIAELRAFGGLTIEGTAHVLSVSPSTAKRDWRTAKAWLHRELGSEVRP